MIKKLLIVSAMGLAAAPAHAQWAGRYVGVIAGYGFGDAKTTYSGSPGTVGVGGGGPQGAVALANGLPPSSSDHPTGFLGGGEIGYNWQAARTVYGIAADLQGGWVKGSSNSSGGAPVAGFPLNTDVSSVSQTDKLKYLGTVRGRLGYDGGKWLAYGTGGLAYGQVRSDITATQGFLAAPLLSTVQQPSPASSTSTRTGWTLGGGLEYKLAGQWSATAEYLYYDLGKTTTTMGFSSFNPGSILFTSSNNSATTRWTGSIIRVGLNYKF